MSATCTFWTGSTLPLYNDNVGNVEAEDSVLFCTAGKGCLYVCEIELCAILTWTAVGRSKYQVVIQVDRK